MIACPAALSGCARCQVAELINTYESDGAKEAVKALKKRLGQEPRVLALTLTLLESLMKNCSASFHVEVRIHVRTVWRCMRACVYMSAGPHSSRWRPKTS